MAQNYLLAAQMLTPDITNPLARGLSLGQNIAEMRRQQQFRDIAPQIASGVPNALEMGLQVSPQQTANVLGALQKQRQLQQPMGAFQGTSPDVHVINTQYANYRANGLSDAEARTKAINDYLSGKVTLNPITGEMVTRKPLPPVGMGSVLPPVGGEVALMEESGMPVQEGMVERERPRELPIVTTARQKSAAAEEGKLATRLYRDIQDTGRKATDQIEKYKRLDKLLDEVDVGKFAGTKLELKKIAKATGVNLKDWGVTDDVGPAEAGQAISNRLALALRNPSGGEGMPGQMSDADRRFLIQSVPGLENTAEGRKLLVEYQVRILERQKEIAKMAQQYKKSYGILNEGFDSMVTQYVEDVPFFNEEDYQKIEAAQAPPSTEASAVPTSPSTAPLGAEYVGMHNGLPLYKTPDNRYFIGQQ